MKFERIQSENLSNRVVNQIINSIEQGKLSPGDKLPSETELAVELGVSRGILREALTILQYQGLISRKPKDGTYIRKLDVEKISANSMVESLKKATYLDLLDMREALEVKAIELAIARGEDSKIQEVKDYLESVDINDENYNISDYNFHQKLAELSQNELLMNFIDNYYGLIKELGEKSNRNSDRKREILIEHRAIIDAILLRDTELGKKMLVYHLSNARENLNKNL